MIEIWGSLQAHRVMEKIENGVCPCIGTTDFGLPRVVGYEEWRFMKRIPISTTDYGVIGNGSIGDLRLVGKINTSQDGKVITMSSIVPCLTSGHRNSPKIIVHEDNSKSR